VQRPGPGALDALKIEERHLSRIAGEGTMKRLIRHTSVRFTRRNADYSYPQLRAQRLRVSQREGTTTWGERDRSGLSRSEGAEGRA
jgi:hypothetical protein